jgi:hypothetical protein
VLLLLLFRLLRLPQLLLLLLSELLASLIRHLRQGTCHCLKKLLLLQHPLLLLLVVVGVSVLISSPVP